MKTYPITSAALSWLESILHERFGLSIRLAQTGDGLSLKLASEPNGEIVFPQLLDCFTRASSDLPCGQWNAQAEGWQQVLGEPLPMPGMTTADTAGKPLIEITASRALVHYDILGLTYWMLNRIEEIGRTDLDNHGRFPAVSSHAFQHGYLECPIVDEWLHVLGQVIVKLWPHVQLRQHQFSMKVSHDVDSPSLYAFKSWKMITRMMAGHLLKRRDLKATLQAPWLKLRSGKAIAAADPHNTFDWIMRQSEQHGLTSAFYFICGGHDARDADYQPDDPRIRALMRDMHARGHEIGLHPSYQTYQNPTAIAQEADTLRRICAEEGIKQSAFGGRMHYLRWEHPTTLQAWEDAGMAYDTTLSYADRPGFRCGTCFEYQAFNPVTDKPLKIRIRPLVVMECTVIAERYMNLGYSQQALDKFLELKDTCRKVDGCFTLLWHNSHFVQKGDFNFYGKLIAN